MYLNLLIETFTNGFRAFFLDYLSIIAIFFGICIIISKNPVFSVLFLIGLFFSIAVYLMMIGLSFIGLSYLLVYVGAISILFLFILMLINVRISELLTDNNNSVFLAILAVLSFNFPVHEVLPYCVSVTDLLSGNMFFSIKDFISNIFNSKSLDLNLDTSKLVLDNYPAVEIASVTSKIWDASMVETNHITSIGNILYTNLFIFLIITSLILLLAMVGAIVISINRSSTQSSTVDNIKPLSTNNNYSFITTNS